MIEKIFYEITSETNPNFTSEEHQIIAGWPKFLYYPEGSPELERFKEFSKSKSFEGIIKRFLEKRYKFASIRNISTITTRSETAIYAVIIPITKDPQQKDEIKGISVFVHGEQISENEIIKFNDYSQAVEWIRSRR